MRIRSAVPALCLVTLAACVGPASPKAGMPGGGDGTRAAPKPVVTTPRSLVIADTEREIWPDAADRTQVRMAELRRFIADYREGHGRLPAGLADFLPRVPRSRWLMQYDQDGWDRPLRYELRGEDYEIRSAGPDAVFGSDDDIFVTMQRGTRWG
jgi:hypothetical protein